MKTKTSASADEVKRIKDWLFSPDARRPRHRPANPKLGERDLFLLFWPAIWAQVDGEQKSSLRRALRVLAEMRGMNEESVRRQYHRLSKRFQNFDAPEEVLAALQRLGEPLREFDKDLYDEGMALLLRYRERAGGRSPQR